VSRERDAAIRHGCELRPRTCDDRDRRSAQSGRRRRWRARRVRGALVRLGGALPGLLDQVVWDDQTVLLQRYQVGPVVVVVDPAAPHLRVGLAVLAAVLGAVLDERADGRVHHAVVVPPRVAQVALEQLAVVLVGQGHQQGGVAVGDVARLVGLHGVEHRGQQVVAVRRRLGRHRHEQGVRERGLGHDRQVDAGRGDRVTGDEPLGELPPDGAAVVAVEVAQAVVEER